MLLTSALQEERKQRLTNAEDGIKHLVEAK